MGVNAHCTETYLEEISVASWKDVITITPQVTLNLGILIIYFLGFIIEVIALRVSLNNFLFIKNKETMRMRQN